MLEEIRLIMQKFDYEYKHEIYGWIKGDIEINHESAEFLHKNKKLEEYLKERETKKEE